LKRKKNSGKDKKSNLEASFYIEVEIIKPNGNKIKKTVGQKGKTRSGVRDYAIKKVIIDEDESDLFNIANNFGIRHHRKGQKKRYDEDIFLNWIFYYYLVN